MRIAVINLTGGGMSGGYKKYLRNVIPRMAANPVVDTLLCASPASLNVQDWFNPLPKVEFVNCKPFRFLYHGVDYELEQNLEKFSPDVIFVPVERSFRFNKVPVVKMIQNMEPFVSNIDSNPFIERVKLWIQYLDAKRAIKQSDRIIALSKFVSDFLATRRNIPNEEIGLVYHGIDVKKNENGRRPHVIPQSWHGQFIFTAGSIRPARGLEDLLSAMTCLISQGHDTIKLVIAGETVPIMTRYQKKLKNWILAHNLADRICWAGSLDEKEMTWCYQNCRAFVMTSRVESFGMIAGEAMAHGCVCISVDNPCLPEIFGDAATYYPPRDGKALAAKSLTALSMSDVERKEFSERAIAQAQKFSWDVCAERTVTELARVASR